MSYNYEKIILQKFPDIKIENDVPTGFFSFIRTGGTAKTVLFPKSITELSDLTVFLNGSGIKFVVLGKCSNILFSDKPLSLIIIKTDLLTKTIINGMSVYAECGVGLCQLGVECMKSDLSGFEFACGIPGSVGGGIIMNAGAFKSNISNVLTKVYVGGEKIKILSKEECNFSYRNSRFLTTEECVLAAEFLMTKGDTEILRKKIYEITSNRNNIQPKGLTLGSTFKNPENISAGELIDKTGLKGFGIGGAVISKKHANFIINIGGATSTDIKKLIDYIKDTVFKRYKIMLEEEIRYIGEF